jgi:L-aminopeptidase/D-esterase-like protein
MGVFRKSSKGGPTPNPDANMRAEASFMKGLTDIPGIRVGHASDYDGMTGCTVVLCESGATGGVDIRGSASGTQEIDVLNPLHVTPGVHGICLAGGSAFGLEAASGVRRYLAKKRIGFAYSGEHVPIVPSAILFDLSLAKSARPNREMGETAAAAATSAPVVEGNVGAGVGATIGKLFGLERAMKGGVGSATVELRGPFEGVLVSALAVVNAFGDVVDPLTGAVVAGARKSATSRDFAVTAAAMKRGEGRAEAGRNTTLAVVATNAKLSKLEATKLAHFGQQGMIRTISPVHTLVDGDIVFALATGEKNAPLMPLCIAAAEAVSEAILRAVRTAKTLGGVPGLAG